MSASSAIARLREAFDQDHALALLRGAISTPSVTGEEGAFAAMLKDELVSIGAEGVVLRDFAPGRPNVWGVRRGRPGADTLLLAGHTDTVHVRGWRERWAGTEREDPFGGALVDGAVWGRGASDLKAGLCATIEAVRTLERAGVPLEPTLLIAFVGDEESGEPGTGVSAGARAFAEAIGGGEAPKPDMAIYVEPTMLDVYVAHMGFFLCDIKVIGKSAYFGTPELGVDALKAAHSVLGAIWRYSDALSAGLKHPLVGSGFVLPTGIEGGGYIAVPGECAISLIAKIPPESSSTMSGTAWRARRAARFQTIASACASLIPRAAIIPSAARRSKARRTKHGLRGSSPLFAPSAPTAAGSRLLPTGRNSRSSPRWGFPASISRRATSASATRRKRTSCCKIIAMEFWRSPSSSPVCPPKPSRRRRAA